MKNDQYFEPGDKVMRVTESCKIGAPYIGPLEWGLALAPYGKVMCVETFCAHPIWSSVRFIGCNGWFTAACFRKVEEIKLCINAVKSIKQKELA